MRRDRGGKGGAHQVKRGKVEEKTVLRTDLSNYIGGRVQQGGGKSEEMGLQYSGGYARAEKEKPIFLVLIKNPTRTGEMTSMDGKRRQRNKGPIKRRSFVRGKRPLFNGYEGTFSFFCKRGEKEKRRGGRKPDRDVKERNQDDVT